MSAAHTVPHTRILLGLVGGAAIGCAVNALVQEGKLDADFVAGLVKYFTKPIGDIFLNLLFMAIIPLVFASIAVGVTRLGGGENVGRVGAKTFAYFLVTTACAAAIGLSLVNAIRPGDQIPAGEEGRNCWPSTPKEAGRRSWRRRKATRGSASTRS